MDFKKCTDNIIKDVSDYTKGRFKDVSDSLVDNTKVFLKENSNDLQHWSNQLVKGDLTREEFNFLIQSKKELLDIKLIADLEIIKIEKDKLLQEVLCIVIDQTFKLIDR